MRADMHEVVIERPRTGGGLKQPKGYKKKFNKTDLEEQPKSEKIRRKWIDSWSEKQFSDLLGPLRRWLYSKVGENWDDIYSEIRSNLSSNSKMQNHVLNHLWDWIILEVVMVDGQPCHANPRIYGVPIDAYGDDEFYVHPKTKILHVVYHKAIKKKDKPKFYWKNKKSLIQFKKINGLWYELQLARCDEVVPYSPEETIKRISTYSKMTFFDKIPARWRDKVFNESLTEYELSEKYGGKFVGLSKKQTSKRDIKKFKLSV